MAIQNRRSHHDVSHLNCSKGWSSFAKIFKSSKTSENAFAKGFFSTILLKPPDFDEMVSMTVFEVVKFASVVKIDVGLSLGDQGIIFAQTGPILSMVCCTGSVTSPLCFRSNFIKGWGTFAKIFYSSKILPLSNPSL